MGRAPPFEAQDVESARGMEALGPVEGWVAEARPAHLHGDQMEQDVVVVLGSFGRRRHSEPNCRCDQVAPDLVVRDHHSVLEDPIGVQEAYPRQQLDMCED